MCVQVAASLQGVFTNDWVPRLISAGAKTVDCRTHAPRFQR